MTSKTAASSSTTLAATCPSRPAADIVAGNKTIINNIIQPIAKELTTTPYKFLACHDIVDRDIFYGRDTIIEELAAQSAATKSSWSTVRRERARARLLMRG
jgi:hypothetical protein